MNKTVYFEAAADYLNFLIKKISRETCSLFLSSDQGSQTFGLVCEVLQAVKADSFKENFLQYFGYVAIPHCQKPFHHLKGSGTSIRSEMWEKRQLTIPLLFWSQSSVVWVMGYRVCSLKRL